MSLPLRTNVEDAIRFCRYLLTKPTGATPAEAKKVLGASMLDSRKVSGLKQWGCINDDGGRLKITDECRAAFKNNQAKLPQFFQNVIKNIEAYNAVIERAFHTGDDSINVNDVASYWHANFSSDVQSNDEGITEQALCFFQVVQGAGLGSITLGRRGSATRVDFNREAIEVFVENRESQHVPNDAESQAEEANDHKVKKDSNDIETPVKKTEEEHKGVQRVFITHGKNKKIVERLKEIVTYGKLTPVIAEEHETLSKPIPDKVMDDMRACDAAIIHVAVEQILIDEEGNKHHKINENVLIEIGAAMALYKHNNRYNFILLVESGVQLPSNLSGLYECRYEGDKLDMEATMKLLKSFNEFSVS
jgi:predicted nucleotide-binding protein